MNTYEELITSADNVGIDVIDYPFSDRIKGLYCDGTIAINKNISTDIEKTCTLAEELGHYHTAVGDILDQSSVSNRKQELKGRIWAYNKLIGLNGIIRSNQHGCLTLHDTADYLDVTESFLLEALQYYRAKYGTYTTIDNYVIYFEPTLGVFKLI